MKEKTEKSRTQNIGIDAIKPYRGNSSQSHCTRKVGAFLSLEPSGLVIFLDPLGDYQFFNLRGNAL